MFNTAAAANASTRVVDFSSDQGWWDVVELTKLILSHNRIRCLPERVGALEFLSQLDLNHNMLEEVPASLGSLQVPLYTPSTPPLELNRSRREEAPASLGSL